MNTRTTHAALDAHLKAMQGLPFVAFENVKTEPPKDGVIYIKVNFLPGGREYATLGGTGSSHDTGIYQVGISAPVAKGSGDAETLADRIIKHFERRTLAGGVRTKLPTSSPALLDGARLWLAVSIPFIVDSFFTE